MVDLRHARAFFLCFMTPQRFMVQFVCVCEQGPETASE
jgi:hypothetical protein